MISRPEVVSRRLDIDNHREGGQFSALPPEVGKTLARNIVYLHKLRADAEITSWSGAQERGLSV
jgi:hypothetical protein